MNSAEFPPHATKILKPEIYRNSLFGKGTKDRKEFILIEDLFMLSLLVDKCNYVAMHGLVYLIEKYKL